jgi:hypothetical protein
VIAVALGVIAAVLLLAVGVVTATATPDSLTFFGASIRTTSAQVFLIGAICTWALLVASWLLMVGIRRSRERGADLAAARRQREAAGHDGSTAGPGSLDGGGYVSGGSVGGAIGGAVDRDADTLVFPALTDRTGLRRGPHRNPAA